MNRKTEIWYDNPKDKLLNAYKLIHGFFHTSSKKHDNEKKIFTTESIVRFIYESNTIEKEGMNWHETKKLLFKPADKIPKYIKRLESIGIEPCVWLPESSNLDRNEPRIILKYKDLRKEPKMVAQHFNSFSYSIYLARFYRYVEQKRLCWDCLNGLINNIKPSRKHRNEVIKNLFNGNLPTIRPKKFYLFSERRIKRIHKLLSDGLIHDEDGGAGNYRTIPIMTGPDSNYPSPELIQNCMKIFIKRANNCIDGKGDPIRKAAKISGEFVLIHPFADFNGRMSRIIMNSILSIYSFPFPIAIRATKKSRRRYFYSLKLARANKWDHLNCLISLEFIQAIERLNSILKQAGLKPITKKGLSNGQIKSINSTLNY